MNYEQFKESLLAELRKQAGEGFTVSLCRIPKNNGIIMEAVTVWKQSSFLAPAVYLEGYYRDMLCGKTLSGMAAEILETAQTAEKPDCFRANDFVEWESARKNIFSKVINYEKNRKLLNQIPHIRILDLAIVFYYQVPESQIKEATILIRESHRESWEVTEQELYETAKMNDRRGHPAKFQEMEELIRGLMSETEEWEFEAELKKRRCRPVPMYVLTNKQRYLGAVCMFYEKMPEILAEYLNSDFFVLPSSIHECIIVPDSGMFSKQELREMVCEVNQTQVQPQEILSDQVYYYSREKQKLSLE